MPFGPASLLGVERFSAESEAPLELLPGDDDIQKEALIRAIYKQVLGNAYVMESERQLVAESQFKLGEISVRELIRRIAKSDLYRSRFFESCPRYRYIELAFRHLMGRAPVDFEEMRAHAERLDSLGYEADIDSFLDSDDYQNTTEASITKIFVAERGKAVEERQTELESKKSRLNPQSYGSHQANT